MDVETSSITEEEMEVIVAKGVAMLVLFLASTLCGCIPIVLSRKLRWFDSGSDLKSSNKVVVALLAFGGGVLLSTTFMHLVPEVDENIEYLQSLGTMSEYSFSLAPLLMCSGFFIMYLVEELVHCYIHRREKRNKQNSLFRTVSIRRSQKNGDVADMSVSTTALVDEHATVKKGNCVDPEKEIHNHAHSHHIPCASDGDDEVVASLRGLLIVLALSVHELFEGLAVGLESSASNVWYMFGAVSAHKLVIAFCIGVELLANKTKTWLAIVYILTFAVVSPLGIGIGIALVGGSGATGAGVYSVVLQGLASGTLMYVIFFEVLQRERSGLLQFISAVVGFAVMFGLQLLTPHSHSHGTGDDHGHSHDK